MDPGTKEKTT